MNLSLRNLLRRLTGRAATQSPARPAQTTRLRVESLEDRLVPVSALTNYHFALATTYGGPANAALLITYENNTTGAFSGVFWNSFGYVIPISGQLTAEGCMDSMTFAGVNWVGNQLEEVSFSGYVTDTAVSTSTQIWMSGQLAQTNLWSYGGSWYGNSTSTYEYGQAVLW
jgi:hypothetical protein